MKCPFCNMVSSRILADNDDVYAIRDSFPVSEGHTLVIPHRHFDTWFIATEREKQAIMKMVEQVKEELDRALNPAGYNIGFNEGAAAGQRPQQPHLFGYFSSHLWHLYEHAVPSQNHLFLHPLLHH